jgi:hypothetical protein
VCGSVGPFLLLLAAAIADIKRATVATTQAKDGHFVLCVSVCVCVYVCVYV